ncbi:MAG: tetratricopeptide repeat protein [Verrucomicrobia bacterium]|nr:MAG: tetratricopeptide repeat protein [Verrucomicrobiota bacterium]
MQEQSPKTPPPRIRWLPLACAVVALALYGVSLNHWVSIQSLPILAQIAAWNDEVPVFHPLLYIVTRPLVLLPPSLLPIAANGLAAILAALAVGILARCVQLIPQDRTHAQRIRGHSDGRLLDIPLAWLPPVFAAGLFGLQLTVWEHATAVTGESLHALVFALCVLCLLEFRRSRRESWLNGFVVLLGIGMADDWSMVGFFPFFVAAMLWIGGWEMLRVGRLLRLAALGCTGLLLFFLMPLVAHGRTGLPADVGGVVGILLQGYKTYLLGVPKGRFILLAAVMILPLAVAGIRWGSPRGSGFERLLTQLVLTSLQIVWLGANVWFAFDGIVSPRALVTTATGYAGIPLLTYHFCGALAAGNLAALYLLLGGAKPDPKWPRDQAAFAPLAKVFAGLVVLGGLAVPAALLVRNWTAIAIQNGPVLSDLATALAEPLPRQPALVVTEDGFLEALFRAQILRDPASPPHLIFNTRKAPDVSYRRHLDRIHGARWPALKAIANATENVGGVFLAFLNQASADGKAFYLNPAVTFITEMNQLRPRGLVYQLGPYAKRQITPDKLGDAEAAAIEAFWKSRAPQLARIASGPRRPIAGNYAAMIWSRAANWSGVELQRNNRLEPAARLFGIATNLVPENVAALVNLEVNARLRSRQPIDASARKPIESLGVSILDTYGPIDEPRFLEQLGDAVLTLGDPLARASAIAFTRALELDPASVDAAAGLAHAFLGADESELAVTAVATARGLAARQKLSPAQTSRLARVDATVRMRTGKPAESEEILLKALEQLPTDIAVLDLLTVLYVQGDQPKKAIPYVDRMLHLKPDDESLLERKGYLHLMAGEFDNAITVLGDLLSRRPDENAARMNRGTAHLLAGHLDLAREDFEGVLRRKPTAVDAMVGLSQVAEGRKDKPEAIRLLERAIETLPETAPLRTNLVQRVATLKAAP